ncbi:CoA transferase [Nitratireductor sp. CAU 1489]|uniref:CoA transferase n=1 Tax=Nitratireductor arenosus TaxID=2682096 RepID=A0A844QCF5_9HYPH|nr:CaiB/BaiF CoA-transferase family protein [Nitratireductor arenosus]MVA95700.1 CoA transferase [Nitratireductor arenosus]
MESTQRTGPLAGLKVVEMAGIGPVPLAGLMLAEMGAKVLRVERLRSGRPFLNIPEAFDLDRHGRDTLKIDLKHADGVTLVRGLAAGADIVIEGYRPGVMERLGLGPEVLCADNAGLVYGRMTGFGQDGPLAERAGHDLTYLALSGVLHAIGPRDGKPLPPLNLVADYGGGTMFLIAGVLAALVARARTGKGQVVDAAMIDGASMLAAPFFAFMAAGIWQDKRGANLLDSGCPFYDTYETADDKHVAVACLEPQFFAEFARLLPLEERLAKAQYDTARWQEMRAAIAARLKCEPRDHWASLFADTDACVAPVLSLAEAPAHPHNRARATHVETGGLTRPGPAPRFARTPSAPLGPSAARPTAAILGDFGIEETRAETLVDAGILGV